MTHIDLIGAGRVLGGISVREVQELIASGELASHRLAHGEQVIEYESVMRLAQQRRKANGN